MTEQDARNLEAKTEYVREAFTRVGTRYLVSPISVTRDGRGNTFTVQESHQQTQPVTITLEVDVEPV